MKKSLPMIVGVALLFITACATSATKDITIKAEAAPKTDLAGYKTYAWLGSAQLIYDPAGRWEPPNVDMDAEIKFLINRELRKRGMTEVDDSPDMVVAYAAGVDMTALKLEKDPSTKIEMMKNVPQGSLVVLLVDADTELPIWAGLAEADIHQDPPLDLVKKRLDFAVSKMFKKYPSQKSSVGSY